MAEDLNRNLAAEKAHEEPDPQLARRPAAIIVGALAAAIVIVALISAMPNSGGEIEVIMVQDAGDHTDTVRTVRGHVSNVYRQEKFAFINFEGVSREGFMVFVPKDAYESLPADFETLYNGRELLITGEIYSYKGRPNIKLLDKSQVQLVPRDQEKPQVSATASQEEQAISPDEVASIDMDEALKFLGQTKSVEGVVSDVKLNERYAYINFEGAGEGGFYAYVPASAFPKLPDDFEAFYSQKRIRVAGNIMMHQGAPQIIVTQANQIKVLFDGEESSE